MAHAQCECTAKSDETPPAGCQLHGFSWTCWDRFTRRTCICHVCLRSHTRWAATQIVARSEDKLIWCWLSAATEQFAAQICALDEIHDQRAAAAAARRSRGRTLKLLVMGAVTGASLALADLWRSKPKEQRRQAAAAARSFMVNAMISAVIQRTCGL